MGGVTYIRRGPGRIPTADGRRAFDLFPTDRANKRWLFAVGFSDGRVVLGSSRTPRGRVSHHWCSVDGRVRWAHVFGSVEEWPRHQARSPVEQLALAELARIGEQINRSQYFRGLSRDQAIAAVRRAIRAADQPSEAKAA